MTERTGVADVFLFRLLHCSSAAGDGKKLKLCFDEYYIS
jgi:hypothetical protein